MVGFVYNPKFSANNALVVVYKLDHPGLGFIDPNGKFAAVNPLPELDLRQFAGTPTIGDHGGNITARETCFTVGQNQVCYLFSIADAAVQSSLRSAASTLTNQYHLGNIQIDFGGGVAELMGDTQRVNCQAAIIALTSLGTVPGVCQPTVYFTSVVSGKITQYPNFTVVGIMVVPASANVAAGLAIDTQNNPGGELYTGDGTNKVPLLVAGSYLIVSMENPAKPGDLEAELLLDSHGNSYIIPGRHVEGFGKSTNPSAPGTYQAGIDPVSCQAGMP